MRPREEEFGTSIERLFPGTKMVRTVTVQVTDACNLRCTYCYQIAKKNHRIPVDVAISYIKQVLDGDNPYINLENTGGIILDFIGGEPTLAMDVIEEVTEWAVNYMIDNHHPWATRFRASICSNGTTYEADPRIKRYLHKWGPLVSMTFSIDGNKQLHDACRVFPDGRGSYDLAAAAAQSYAKEFNYGRMPATKLTLAPTNVQYFCDAHINLIETLGYRSIFCNCCYEKGWTIEHAKILYKEMKKLTDWLFEHEMANDVYISIFDDKVGGSDPTDRNWCGGTGEMISVDWKGDIYPCIRYMESSLGDDQPPVIIGTVEGGIAATEEQKKCIDCLKCITRSSQSTKECMECPISQGCAWCSGYNYQEFGTANKRATHICEMHKARVLANLYFWAKFKLRYPDDIEEGCHEWNIPDEWAEAIIGKDECDMIKALLKSLPKD
ncbi:MAG: radical SAM peptide maturase, CXXX-repeat target family [Muribaculaceae bacterium]|nr:radical SAM peptide maturase, CXXX-repeat target family [Muribaculaceae bacterium]